MPDFYTNIRSNAAKPDHNFYAMKEVFNCYILSFSKYLVQCIPRWNLPNDYFPYKL